MRLVYVPCKDIPEAKKIARVLIEEKLAFCTNIISPIESIYLWKGKVEEGKESLLLIKTTAKLVKKVFQKIKDLHSYDIPEIISLKIDATTEKIKKYVENELQ